MPRRNPYARDLAQVARDLPRTRRKNLAQVLVRAIPIVAAAGDLESSKRLLDHFFALDRAVCGKPALTFADVLAYTLGDASAADRAAMGEQRERELLLSNAYVREPPADDGWRDLPVSDVWRRVHAWQRIQVVARTDERAAIERLREYLAGLPHEDRGSYGKELVLGLDLALRNGRDDLVAEWLAAHGHRFGTESALLVVALSFRAIARAAADGRLRTAVGLDEAVTRAATDAILEAEARALAAVPPARPPKVQKRRVSCEYSQVHLVPDTLDAIEREQVFFHRDGESEQGMSLFPTQVGIATPAETHYVDAEITMEDRDPGLGDVVQAVAFPIEVRGPIRLRSVADDDSDEPLLIPPGTYDVLARFFAKRAPKRSSSLRTFRLTLSFLPAGTLGAPRCLRMEQP